MSWSRNPRRRTSTSPELYTNGGKPCKGDEDSEDDSAPNTCSRTQRLSSLYHGTWPVERSLWTNQQTGLADQQSISSMVHNDVASVMSFSSSVSVGVGCPVEEEGIQGRRRLGAKVDVVYGLLGMLLGGTEGCEDMSATLLSMSSSVDSCLAMRQSGCLPLLVQLIYTPSKDPETRQRAARALRNVVQATGEERFGRREVQVLGLLEQLRDYCQMLKTTVAAEQSLDESERHPSSAIASIMKISFDEAHRHVICLLGGLHAIAELIETDHEIHGSECDDRNCITLRRYAGMALTNLTFGDGNNKALLCSFREFMKALVAQLCSPSDDLRQVTASVLRNLSWRADTNSKKILREVGAVTGLTKAAMEGGKESTLKSILSALWNLSAHCSNNKVDICAVQGALTFLVDMLSYEAPSKTLAIVENAGGILRNVSSHVAVREDYRAILREKGCLQVLLRHLRSPSLTIVSNACGALWNLSARCPQDQRMLWELGAVPMLRSLIHSKHKMISMGSGAALRNLVGARPGNNGIMQLDSIAMGLGLPTLPTLITRRQRALKQEIDQNLAETCDNIEPTTSPSTSPIKDGKFKYKVDRHFVDLNAGSIRAREKSTVRPHLSSCRSDFVVRSESRESVRSVSGAHSESMLERVSPHVLNGGSQVKQQPSPLYSGTGFNAGVSTESSSEGAHSDKEFVLQYKSAGAERQKPSELGLAERSDIRCTESTMPWASTADQESSCSQNLLHTSIEDSMSPNPSNKSPISERDEDEHSSVSEENHEGNGSSTVTKPHFQNIINRSNASSPLFAMAHNKSNSSYEEDVNDQPVDYSKKYTEQNSLRQNSSVFDNVEIARSPKKEFPDHDPKVDLFGDYAETDLDQPTDYSLRYAEDDTDEDEKQSPVYFPGNEQEFVHEDTVKTYCTEGTPYETPFNFSTATSMSDLRVEDSKEGDKKTDKKIVEVNNKEDGAPLKAGNNKPSETQPTDKIKDQESNGNKSDLSLGHMTPEKPVNYCEEGTPGYFSRVSSLSSLGSALVSRNNTGSGVAAEESLACIGGGATVAVIEEQNAETSQNSKPDATISTSCPMEAKNDARVVDKEGKMVTFGGEDHYAEQTPLMFSRCSSLGSLSGFEQHSIHDDRSSIVSDFSRRTSGIVSPSELPDSPTQTVPPSPLHHKPQADFVNGSPDEVSRLPGRNLSGGRRHPVKRSVFEDDIAAFKEESTPIEFSAATSLSSLTIDDEPTIATDAKLKGSSGKSATTIPEEEKQNTSANGEAASVADGDVDQVSDGDEDDEDMLAACINIGMQNNRYRQSFRRPSLQKAPQPGSNLARYQTSSALNQLDTGVAVSPAKDMPGFKKAKANSEAVTIADTVHVYCTEDTPADISPAGSHSNLSALSMLSTPANTGKTDKGRPLRPDVERTELSDDDSNLSEDDDKILAECIQSGMPKVRQNTSPPATSLPASQKPGLHLQRLNIGSSPSSSPAGATYRNKDVLCKPLPLAAAEVMNQLSDDSSDLSEDEGILAECIQSGMPKARLNTPPPVRPLSSLNKPKLHSEKLNPCGASSFPAPGTAYANKTEASRKPFLHTASEDKTESFDDSSSLSEDEDIILAECIQSGMPKAPPPASSLPVPKKPERRSDRLNFCSTPSSSPVGALAYANKDTVLHKVPSHSAATDEVEAFATEDTPCNFSVASGISDLTINSIETCTAARIRKVMQQTDLGTTVFDPPRNTPVQIAGVSSMCSLHDIEGECDVALHPKIQSVLARHVLGASGPQSPEDEDTAGPSGAVDSVPVARQPDSVPGEVNPVPSRHGSTSSLSGESFGSVEEWEQRLLELCINSGMPKSKRDVEGRRIDEKLSKLPAKPRDEAERPAEDQNLHTFER